MRRFQFSDEERSLIAKERFYHPNPRVQRRMEILWLKLQGETHERIAELADVSRRTVQRVLDIFAEGRLEAVRQFHEKGRANALAPHRLSLEEEFRQRPPRIVAEACDRIEQLTGVRRQPTQVRLFLRETLGLRWRKVAAIPVPPKKSVEEHAATQADFLKDGTRTTAERNAGRTTDGTLRRCGAFRVGVVFGRGLERRAAARAGCLGPPTVQRLGGREPTHARTDPRLQSNLHQ
jgi:transposase